ncbi:YoaK family protein [Paenibacillus sp. BSR1-1]|uniref:YoaK family protein n=1 Tax=Paenibacillus sp. BSR1-1 TaxID=3020845 RepID=UPI0025AF91AD|nr:YoaK family protein [Paenibacillus sp. BSR1-1]MDN3016427.1 YoaK family protein [Paenibacillus sp. BSR1-1]
MEKTQDSMSQNIALSYLRKYVNISMSKIPRITPESIGLGILLALVGGFLDAYTYVSRDGVFATSQTGNIVLLGVEIAQGHWRQGLKHLPPILAFVIGVIVAEGLKHPQITRIFPYPARSVLFLEGLVLVIVGTWPPQFPDMIVTVTIAFVSSVQISSFRTLVKWQFNSAMVTGNLRTAAEAAYTALVLQDPQSVIRFIDFTIIVISFLAGAFIGAISTLHFGIKAIWIVSAILICAMLILNANPKTLLNKG